MNKTKNVLSGVIHQYVKTILTLYVFTQGKCIFEYTYLEPRVRHTPKTGWG